MEQALVVDPLILSYFVILEAESHSGISLNLHFVAHILNKSKSTLFLLSSWSSQGANYLSRTNKMNREPAPYERSESGKNLEAGRLTTPKGLKITRRWFPEIGSISRGAPLN
jgi:hypothetical protein